MPIKELRPYHVDYFVSVNELKDGLAIVEITMLLGMSFCQLTGYAG